MRACCLLISAMAALEPGPARAWHGAACEPQGHAMTWPPRVRLSCAADAGAVRCTGHDPRPVHWQGGQEGTTLCTRAFLLLHGLSSGMLHHARLMLSHAVGTAKSSCRAMPCHATLCAAMAPSCHRHAIALPPSSRAMPYHAALLPCHLMLLLYHTCLQVMADPDLAGMMTNPKVSAPSAPSAPSPPSFSAPSVGSLLAAAMSFNAAGRCRSWPQ